MSAAAWVLATLLLALPALALGWVDPEHPDALHAALIWQRAHAIDEPWRLVTAAWVHGSALHLGANLLGAALVAALGLAAGCGRREAAAWLLAWPLTQAALLLDPRLHWYIGASGVLHAGVAVAAVSLLWTPRRLVGAALLLGLLAKVLSESPWWASSVPAPMLGVAVAPLAHAAGAVAGAACALLLQRLAGSRSTKQEPPSLRSS